VLFTRRLPEIASAFEVRRGLFRQQRLRAKLTVVASVALWSAGLLGALLVAGLAFAGLQSGR